MYVHYLNKLLHPKHRTEQNQLKDIKFDFLLGTGKLYCSSVMWQSCDLLDTADAIAKDLLTAGLLEGRELVVGKVLALFLAFVHVYMYYVYVHL